MEKYESIELKCSKCGKPVDAKGELWLVNDAVSMKKEQKYICSSCIDKWKKNYEVKSCTFEVTNIDVVAHTKCRMGDLSVSTMALLQPPLHRTINVPQEFVKDVLDRLADFRANQAKIAEEQQKQNLKYVDFMEDEWEGHYFNCETREGVKYERIIFKLDQKKQIVLKPDQDMPALVLKFVQQELNKRTGVR